MKSILFVVAFAMASLLATGAAAGQRVESPLDDFLESERACWVEGECIPGAVARIDFDVDGNGTTEVFLGSADTEGKAGPLYSVYSPRPGGGFDFLAALKFNDSYFYVDKEAGEFYVLEPLWRDAFDLISWSMNADGWTEERRTRYELTESDLVTQKLHDDFLDRASKYLRDTQITESFAREEIDPEDEDLYKLSQWLDPPTGLPAPGLQRIDFDELHLAAKAQRVRDATPPKLAITSPGALVIGPPAIGVTLTFSDPESGIAAGSLAVQLDGTSITAACAATGSGATCPATVVAEGGHVLEAEIRNIAGLRTTARLEFQRRATPDTTAPSITILKPAAGAPTVDTVQPEILIRYTDVGSAVDPGTLKVRVDGILLDYCQTGRELARCPGPRLLPGTFLLTAAVADLAGNSAMATSSFDVPETRGDRTPPQIRLSNPTTAKVYTESTFGLSFDLEDDFSSIDPGTIRIHYDGEPITSSCEVTSSAAICLLPAIVGPHEGKASVADRAGNSALLAFELEIAAPASDTQAPEIVLLSGGEPLEGKIFDSSDFLAEIHYLEQGTGLDTDALKVEIDGRAISCDGPVAGKTSECQEGSLSGGKHVLRAEAADEIGNKSVASASFTMPNPRAPGPPEISIAAPQSLVELSTEKVRIWAIRRGGGAAPVDFSSIHVELDGDSSILEKCFDMWELDCWVPPLPVGVHRLEIELADLQGRSNSVSFEFEVYETTNDRLAPRLQFLSPAEQETLVGVKAIDFTFEMADEIRGSGIDEGSFTFEVDGVDMSALCSASQTGAACRGLKLDDGAHTAVAVVFDRMGNEAKATRHFSTSRNPTSNEAGAGCQGGAGCWH